MHKAIQGQLNDWNYGRGIILDLLSNLNEIDLDKPFPRKQLNTIRNQCEELIKIQTDYISAIHSKTMAFESNLISMDTKTIIATMAQLDKTLLEIASSLSGDELINWFGEDKTIFEHLSAMIGYQQMHIGQIIAFMFATDIQIPDSVRSMMGLGY